MCMEHIIEKIADQTETALIEYEDYTLRRTLSAYDRDVIKKYVHESYLAKKQLRELFQTHPGWDEELQSVRIETEISVKKQRASIKIDMGRLLLPSTDLSGEEKEAIANLLSGREENEQKEKQTIALIDRIAPHTYHKNKKVTRILSGICEALGIASNEKGSEYQKRFAILSEKLKASIEKKTVFVSIHPAHFLTMSNPVNDTRGETLVSCHSLNDIESEYAGGCTGLGLDNVSFIVFSTKNPDDCTSLNNRKTERQHFAYNAANGVLLQNKLYASASGDERKDAIYEAWSQMVKKVLSNAENVKNKWLRITVDREGQWIRTHIDYRGYADWKNEYNKCDIFIQKNEEKNEEYKNTPNLLKTLIIGEKAMCLNCGRYITSGYSTVFCDRCLWDNFERCHDCNEFVANDAIVGKIHLSNGDSASLCEGCSDNYEQCDDCDGFVEKGNVQRLAGTRRYLCYDCLYNIEAAECIVCKEYHEDGKYRYIEDGENTICDDCLRHSNEYAECQYCGVVFDVGHIDSCDTRNYICDECREDEDEEE